MHVAFDPQTFSLQAYGGISRYFMETALGLARLADTEVSVLAFAHLNAYLAAVHGNGALLGWRVPALPEPLRPFLARANQALARRWLARHPVDLVHETYYATARTAPRRVPTVLTVFDMIHEKFPGYAPRTAKVARAKRAAIGRADHLICISENTRRDLIGLYGIEASRTSVVTLGFSPLPGGAAGSRRPFAEPYLLFVGKRGGYKDFETLLRAYAGAAALRREYLLVCFGDASFSRRELRMMGQLGIARERVRHAAGDDAALAVHYRHASLFAYPSRYEGFGMPPLEAMSLDCPVVCSNAASLPEVVGDAALTFDPGDAHALRAAMESALGSRDRAAELRRRGRERIKRFSWDQCARQTRAIYASVLR
jgi:glycosyltransferase involved in cell wall biosynthesis